MIEGLQATALTAEGRENLRLVESITSRYLASLDAELIREGKEGRTREAEAGGPSTFDDWCRAKGFCSACAATGIRRNDNTVGFKVLAMDGDVQRYADCDVCSGTGRTVAGPPDPLCGHRRRPLPSRFGRGAGPSRHVLQLSDPPSDTDTHIKWGAHAVPWTANLCASRDGRTAFFKQGTSKSSIVLAENLQ